MLPRADNLATVGVFPRYVEQEMRTGHSPSSTWASSSLSLTNSTATLGIPVATARKPLPETGRQRFHAGEFSTRAFPVSIAANTIRFGDWQRRRHHNSSIRKPRQARRYKSNKPPNQSSPARRIPTPGILDCDALRATPEALPILLPATMTQPDPTHQQQAPDRPAAGSARFRREPAPIPDRASA